MATDVLKSFLVSLGFQVDERGMKKFTDGVAGATKSVFKLVAAVEGAALAIGASVTAFAGRMEDLYFAAQRLNSSAAGIKAFQNAAKNMGVDVGAANAALQGLSSWMRKTPNSEGFLRSLGVETRDANGKLKQTEDLLVGLGDALRAKNMPFATSSGILAMLGIGDEGAQMALLNGKMSEELKRQQDILRNSQYDEAAKRAHAFMEKLRELEQRVASVGVTIGNSLLKALGPQMEEAARWFEANADEIAAVVSGIGTAIVNVAAIIGPILKTIAQGWKNIYDWVKAAGRAVADFMPESMSDKVGAGTGWLLDKLGIRDQVDRMLGLGGGGGGSSSPSRAPASSGTAPKSSGGAASGSTNSAYQFFRRMGWSHDQAAGIVANLKHESNFNPSAVGDNGRAYGIAQWHPDRQAAFKKWAGKDIRQSSLEEQMGFVHYEMTEGNERRAGALLKAARNAQQAGEIVSRHYERPLHADAEAAKRGASAVQIAQSTTINVNGSGDPAATARAVAGEQGRVAQNTVRNLQSAVQ